MSDKIPSVGDDTFKKEVLDSQVPVLVDFWATWCGPCKAIAPKVDDLASRFSGKVKVAKMNIDDHQNVPQQYGIRSIPTFLLFKNGQVAGQVVGNHPEKLEELVQKFST